MKNTKCCTKCQATEIIRVPGTNQTYGYGNNIKTGATMFNAVLVTKYLCLNCGFIEDWIDDPQDIKKIRKHYIQREK